VREILLALIFFLSWFPQAVLAPDPLHGQVADVSTWRSTSAEVFNGWR